MRVAQNSPKVSSTCGMCEITVAWYALKGRWFWPSKQQALSKTFLVSCFQWKIQNQRFWYWEVIKQPVVANRSKINVSWKYWQSSPILSPAMVCEPSLMKKWPVRLNQTNIRENKTKVCLTRLMVNLMASRGSVIHYSLEQLKAKRPYYYCSRKWTRIPDVIR